MRFLNVEHRGIEPAPGASCEKSREALFLCEKRGKWLNRAAFRFFRFVVLSCIFVGYGGIFAANLKSAMNRNYKINLRREPEGGYTVFVPSLPGCITYGETVDEAIDMAKEAIGLYIEELEERGESVPDDSNVLEYSLNMATV